MTSLGMDISEISKSLIDYENNSKIALDRAGQFFESYLHKFGSDVGVSLVGKTGVNSLINELFQQKRILANQKHLGNGVGGARNIAAHGVDAETQKEWIVTPQASLACILLVPVVIRSLYLYAKKNHQEF